MRLMKRFIPVLLVIAIVMMNNACSVKPQSSKKSATSSRAVMNLPKINSNKVAQSSAYRLGYGDIVEIKFFHNGEYNESVSVRPDGCISLQRIGDVNVLGMTPSELDEIITDNYNEILVEPDVTVFVREFGGQEVYVMGEVGKPGSYPVTKGMTVLRSIVAAGGLQNSAKLNSVLLIRVDQNQRAEVTRLDIDVKSNSKKIRNDIPIQAFDIVYVPKTFIADVNDYTGQLYDIILQPLDVWTRYLYWSR